MIELVFLALSTKTHFSYIYCVKKIVSEKSPVAWFNNYNDFCLPVPFVLKQNAFM